MYHQNSKTADKVPITAHCVSVFVAAPRYEDLDLSSQIERIHRLNKQSTTLKDAKDAQKLLLQRQLRASLRSMNPIDIYIVGSSYTPELALHDSDLDLCVFIGNPSTGIKEHLLYTLQEEIIESNSVNSSNVVGKDPPILRFELADSQFGGRDMKVDLQVNNMVPIRSTKLVACYASIDDRFTKLAVILKLWAKVHKLYDASLGKFSSYGLVLLLIQYLQTGCTPPVLPSLHKKCPTVFHPNIDARTVIKFTIRFSSENRQNLGSLLMGFFSYYSNTFDFDRDSVSVRVGHPIRRRHDNFISIEEPFERTNVAKAIRSRFVLLDFQSALETSYWSLRRHRDIRKILTEN